MLHVLTSPGRPPANVREGPRRRALLWESPSSERWRLGRVRMTRDLWRQQPPGRAGGKPPRVTAMAPDGATCLYEVEIVDSIPADAVFACPRCWWEGTLDDARKVPEHAPEGDPLLRIFNATCAGSHGAPRQW